MTTTAKKKLALPQEKLPSLVIILARERVRRTRVVEALSEQYKFPQVPQKINAANLNNQSWTRLVQEISTPSLFSPQQIFQIDDAHEISAALLEEIVAFSKKIPAGSHLIICAPKLPRANGLMKLAIKAESLIELEELKGANLKKWATKECARHKLKPQDDLTIEALLRASEEDADSIVAMLQQIADYVDGSEFSIVELSALFPEKIDQNDFELLDALIDGNSSRVLHLVKRLELAGKNPFMLIGMLARSYANYTRAAALGTEGLSPQAIQTKCGWTPWIGAKTCNAARKFKTSDLIKRLGAIISADSRLKNKSLGDFAVIEDLTLNLQRISR